jgi:hypothetical protein
VREVDMQKDWGVVDREIFALEMRGVGRRRGGVDRTGIVWSTVG